MFHDVIISSHADRQNQKGLNSKGNILAVKLRTFVFMYCDVNTYAILSSALIANDNKYITTFFINPKDCKNSRMLWVFGVLLQ